ncbi:energy transducer TonB [Runella slithyformis]|nr:energy transducer TonB [Runella slithyformis]
MKPTLMLLFSAFLSFTAFSQAVFADREVDKVAEPQGGMRFLQQFVKDNLQVPFQARVQQVQGRVFVTGTVETDGSTSELKVTKGLHPLCDAEALRVVGLYKAWQPAIKEVKAVRQTFHFSVVFPELPVTNYDSTHQRLVDYFNEKFQFTHDPTEYHFRRYIPVDKNGVVRDDVVFEEWKKKQWKPFFSVPFKRDSLMYKIAGETTTDSVPAYRLTVRDKDWNSYVPEIVIQTNGQVLSSKEKQGNKVVSYSDYYASGALRERQIPDGKNEKILTWYDNGQLKEVRTQELPDPTKPTEMLVIDLWSRDGKVQVKGGNGRGVYTTKVQKEQWIIEQGSFENGKKIGKWLAKRPDSTLYYEETYDKGKLVQGRLWLDGTEHTYTEVQELPKFSGGLSALGMFLGRNIKYPKEAARKNISGKVFISFVVCEDGSLCDYELLKGIGGGCDEEALRVVKGMSGKWLPGTERGQKVRVKYNLPVSFVPE